MKAYHAPNLDIQLTDRTDIVCGSGGITVGKGGNDIHNWNWVIPGAAVVNSDVAKK